MSTHPIDRRRVRPVGGGVDLWRIVTVCAIVAGVFAIAFGIGHIRRSGPQIVERTPPRLAPVPTPIQGGLSVVPAINVAIVKPPPPKPHRPAKTQAASPSVTTSTPAPEVTSTPVVTPTPTPTPAPQTSSPPPTQHSSGGSGSGSGTSFESSG